MGTLAWVKAKADALEFQLPKEELTTGYTCALLTQPAERSGWLIETGVRCPATSPLALRSEVFVYRVRSPRLVSLCGSGERLIL
jgi:hypothetical protein